MPGNVNPHAIVETERRIRPYVRHTPVVEVAGADFGLGCGKIHLKLELVQHSGSFKARGAFANLLMRDVPVAGVVAASGGNHGAAVAYAAHKLKVRAKIFVPEVSSPAKIARIRNYGAGLGAIAQAQRALWEVVRIVAEPGGAAAFSALLSGRYQPRSGERVGVLVSGGNTVAVNFDRHA